MKTETCLTSAEIRALAVEAAQAGDTEQVALCTLALDARCCKHTARFNCSLPKGHEGGHGRMYRRPERVEHHRAVQLARAECARVIADAAMAD